MFVARRDCDVMSAQPSTSGGAYRCEGICHNEPGLRGTGGDQGTLMSTVKWPTTTSLVVRGGHSLPFIRRGEVLPGENMPTPCNRI
jgi:hypothetical protein